MIPKQNDSAFNFYAAPEDGEELDSINRTETEIGSDILK
jgi:hypothetical protein